MPRVNVKTEKVRNNVVNIYSEYTLGRSLRSIASEYDISEDTLKRIFKENLFEIRPKFNGVIFNGNKYSFSGVKGYCRNDKFACIGRDIWEFYVGPIPENYYVYYKDGNKRNIKLNNLELLTKQELHNRRKPKKLNNFSHIRKIAGASAPLYCESCGDSRVLEVAHKPEFKANSKARIPSNSRWPEHVWILCPTCHSLLDRMHYTLEDLGLS